MITYKLRMTAYDIELACAVAYHNQKVKELALAEEELNKLLSKGPHGLAETPR